MKIHIIGGSGSGKSYLAKQLSQKFQIPHFDLDDLQWDNEADCYGVKMPKEKRARLLEEILKKDDWIIEGIYYKWCQQSFADADRIYVLEVPERVYCYRIIKRFIRRKLGLEKGKKETIKSLLGLLRWTKQYQREDMPEIREILKKYPDKAVYLKNREQVLQEVIR